MKNKAVILLSGGLDSLVSLALAKKEFNIELALTFDYGQEASLEELKSASGAAEYFSVKHEVVKLDFLAGLLGNDVWVPNRNGLFLNIAASYCDSLCCDYIVFGANATEAETFTDNSDEFLMQADAFFALSTQKKPKIYAPLKNLSKTDIINIAIEEKIDFTLIKSCYGAYGHCGKCPSCMLLKDAILKSSNKDLIKLFF